MFIIDNIALEVYNPIINAMPDVINIIINKKNPILKSILDILDITTKTPLLYFSMVNAPIKPKNRFDELTLATLSKNLLSELSFVDCVLVSEATIEELTPGNKIVNNPNDEPIIIFHGLILTLTLNSCFGTLLLENKLFIIILKPNNPENKGSNGSLILLFKTTKPSPPAHKPSFCPGCPHTATYLALKSVILEIKKKGKECIVTGDIGCTILGMNKPYEICWTEISMGASIGIAHGLSNHLKDKILVACIGDSSFLHNGIIALINAVHNKANITVIIMDNRYTAMTGHQPNAGSWKEENPTKKHISIKKIARATGAKFVKSTDPYLFRYTKYLIKKAILYPGTAIIICRRACPKKSSPFIHISFRIISKKCKKCAEEGEMKCIENIACPALKLHNGLPEIDPSLCEGCGICAKFCDHHAIVRDIKTLKISIRQNDKIKR